MRDSPPYPPSFQISIARYERYGLRGVMGPDEPHEWVDDNRFTNAIARWEGISRAPTAPGNAGLRARSWQAIQEREEVKKPGY